VFCWSKQFLAKSHGTPKIRVYFDEVEKMFADPEEKIRWMLKLHKLKIDSGLAEYTSQFMIILEQHVGIKISDSIFSGKDTTVSKSLKKL
jgi:hypothetical protein